MKAILMSIRPQHVANILNGIKTLEIRKRFPSDYVGWVYIYVTKGKPYIKECDHFRYIGDYEIANKGYYLNGKVVARFWCDKVEGAYNFYEEELCQLACITEEELCEYAGGRYKTDDLLAIHITNLEIFDEPKEISEYKVRRNDCPFPCEICNVRYCKLTRAPQSWQFIEV